VTEREFRYRKIAARLRNEIASGVLGPGTLLPSESELVTAHEASRVTVRRALEELREEELIESRRGVGWFVRDPAVRQSLHALHTFEQRLLAEGRTSERRVERFGFVPPPARVADLLGPDDVLEVRRINISDGEPFAAVSVWCRRDVGDELSRRDVEDRTFLELLAGRLGGASQTIGATAADAELAATLQIPEGAPLLRVWRTTRDLAGTPLLVSEQHYPSHLTEFHVELPASDARTDGALRLVEDAG
jgi:GntR family transcriptional regulator